jgi:hypothetical protein
LQKSIIVTAKHGASKIKSHNEAWAAQKEVHLKKEDVAHMKKMEIKLEEYVVAMEFWEQYHSSHCWTTATMAISV